MFNSSLLSENYSVAPETTREISTALQSAFKDHIGLRFHVFHNLDRVVMAYCLNLTEQILSFRHKKNRNVTMVEFNDLSW